MSDYTKTLINGVCVMESRHIDNEIITGEKDLSKHEKLDFNLKQIKEIVKTQLKKEYPLCKFSITTKYYSGGQTLHISIMETDFKIIKPFNELSEACLISHENRQYSRESLREWQNSKHFQLSHITDKVYNPDVWNNGVFLTEQGFNLVKRIIELTNKFNWDNSDSQTDYFDVKFYLDLSIGKWDKDFKEVLK